MVFGHHIVHRVHDCFGLFLFLHLHIMDLRQYRRILLHLLHQLVDHLRAGPMFLGNIGLDLLFHQDLVDYLHFLCYRYRIPLSHSFPGSYRCRLFEVYVVALWLVILPHSSSCPYLLYSQIQFILALVQALALLLDDGLGERSVALPQLAHPHAPILHLALRQLVVFQLDALVLLDELPWTKPWLPLLRISFLFNYR